VTNPRRPFRLNVGFIVHQEVGYNHEFLFEYEKIQISDDLDLRHFEGVANIGRTPQGLIVQADFSGETTLECVRCLNEFEHSLDWEMTELQPLIREYALLEIPINPICKPNCKGLCPVCGEDLNQVDCGHKSLTKESPFSALKDLLEE
jgi:uncharacterized protein